MVRARSSIRGRPFFGARLTWAANDTADPVSVMWAKFERQTPAVRAAVGGLSRSQRRWRYFGQQPLTVDKEAETKSWQKIFCATHGPISIRLI
jgi:hypothetical protein